MGDDSHIEWTDATWNPIAGCSRVSPGCDHCYAERLAPRLQAQGVPVYEGVVDGAHWTGRVNLDPAKLDQPLRWRRPRRIFVNSMSDLFYEKLPRTSIDAVFDVMESATWHTFQVLTKRARRMAAYVNERVEIPEDLLASHIWLGVSIESWLYEFRARWLERTPAAVRFLSLEPLIGRVAPQLVDTMDWVIIGGESGPGSRPMRPEWAADIIERCAAVGVPVLFKQAGEVLAREWGCVSRKGSDPAEWPSEFRVREYPAERSEHARG